MMYNRAQSHWVELTDLKEGDTVKVLYLPKGGEFGWDYSVVHRMNNLVGQECTVDDILEGSIYVNFTNVRGEADRCYIPFFCLQKIKGLETVKLNNEYTATIHKENRIVNVGCQTISFDAIEELYKKIQP